MRKMICKRCKKDKFQGIVIKFKKDKFGHTLVKLRCANCKEPFFVGVEE